MKARTPMKFFGAMVIGVVTGVGLTTSLHSQEANSSGNDIEILNRDGEKVEASAIEIIQPKPGGAQEKTQAPGGMKFKLRGGIKNKDGKWIVVDAEGNEKEIDVQGAESIIVNQAVESVTENGEKKTKRVGKAIIIGPDGVRHEIDLGGPMAGSFGEFEIPGFTGIVRAERMNNSFMIGVNCRPVGEALSAQLGLDAGTGLVVLHVSQDSPAQAAGIRKHDILMFADDNQLSKQSDLSEVVEIAGKEKNKVSLTVIRAGKEIGVEVSPVERPASALFQGVPDIFGSFPDEKFGGFNMQFRQMGPGLITGDDLNRDFQLDFEAQMKEVEARMESLRKQIEEQQKIDKDE